LLSSATVLAPASAFAQDAQVPCDAYARTCPAIPGQPIEGSTPGQPAQGGGGTVDQPAAGTNPGGGTVEQPVVDANPIQGGGGGAAELPAAVGGETVTETVTQPAGIGGGAVTGGAGGGTGDGRARGRSARHDRGLL
ncbi:MAG: hypothetical protein KY446_12525, partial [Proteobacteria bacterium]|nr:hypothetical protein [Pseudomonadota bacterium]